MLEKAAQRLIVDGSRECRCLKAVISHPLFPLDGNSVLSQPVLWLCMDEIEDVW